MRLIVALCSFFGIIKGCGASTWAIFEDSDCEQSLNSIAGENGYPDGVCTDIQGSASISGQFQGFMFTVLDAGCSRKSNHVGIVEERKH